MGSVALRRYHQKTLVDNLRISDMNRRDLLVGAGLMVSAVAGCLNADDNEATTDENESTNGEDEADDNEATTDLSFER